MEVKLQTSTTIDLGLVRPSGTELLDVPQVNGYQIRHCDVRYAIFYADNSGTTVTLAHFFLTTGQAFFGRFKQFQGKCLTLNFKFLYRLLSSVEIPNACQVSASSCASRQQALGEVGSW